MSGSNDQTEPLEATAGAETRPGGNELLTIATEITERAVIVTVAGEVDLVTVERLRCAVIDALHAPVGHPVIVDLTRVTFLDCHGLTALVAAKEEASRQDEPLRLVGTRHAVLRPIELSGLLKALPLYDRLADALNGRIRPPWI